MRLAIYSPFSFCLGLQAFFAPTKGTAIAVAAVFCLAAIVLLVAVAISMTVSKPAPLTESPPRA